MRKTLSVAILVALLAIGAVAAHDLGAGIERTEPHSKSTLPLLGMRLATYRSTDCSELGKMSTEAALRRWLDLGCHMP